RSTYRVAALARRPGRAASAPTQDTTAGAAPCRQREPRSGDARSGAGAGRAPLSQPRAVRAHLLRNPDQRRGQQTAAIIRGQRRPVLRRSTACEAANPSLCILPIPILAAWGFARVCKDARGRTAPDGV